MRPLWVQLYTFVLALWVGGMALFTFIVTPVIFRSFGRDLAADVVGRLFPGYFVYNLALAGAALLLFFLAAGVRSGSPSRASLVLLVAALLVNTYITFKLHPAIVQVKQQVASFEAETPDLDARKRFRRLHAVSAVLNIAVLTDGAALLGLSLLLRK